MLRSDDKTLLTNFNFIVSVKLGKPYNKILTIIGNNNKCLESKDNVDSTNECCISKENSNKFLEIKDSSNFAGGSFRYAIDGNKLPHAIYFDKKRPFFWITSEEAEEVFQVIEGKVLNKIDSIW